jgi:hypothetical protein
MLLTLLQKHTMVLSPLLLRILTNKLTSFKINQRINNMDILIPLVIIAVVFGLSVRKFNPKLWKKVTAKFKK